MKQIEIETITVACTGVFNPSIITPKWLWELGLISELDNNKTIVDIVSYKIVQFKLPWCSVTITRDKFEICSFLSPYFELARDLFVGIFTALSHDPITNLKLSIKGHYKMLDKCNQQIILNNFSSVQPWVGILKNPELLNLQVYGSRSDGRAGVTYLSIGPSELITDSISIQLMDVLSFVEDTENKSIGNLRAIKALEEIWEPSMRERDKVVTKIFKS
jgi:hypothetical protein